MSDERERKDTGTLRSWTIDGYAKVRQMYTDILPDSTGQIEITLGNMKYQSLKLPWIDNCLIVV